VIPRLRLHTPSRAVYHLGLALALGAALVGLFGRVEPWRALGPVDIGNDLVAAVGAAWALIQLWSNWHDREWRTAWIWAALGMVLIAAEDHLEEVLLSAGGLALDTAVSVTFWILAAYLLFACCRRYATRRFVMETMQVALVVEIATQGLVSAVVILGGDVFAVDGFWHQTMEAGELLTVTLFVAALLFARLAPLKGYRFAPNEVGRRGRRLFFDFGLGRLARRPRYPSKYPALQVAGLRHLFIIVMILWIAPGAAAAARRASGRGILGQLADMLRLGFRQGIDAKSYYVHDLYMPGGRVAELETLTRVETKNGLNKAINGLGAGSQFARDMNDKLAFWRTCEANGLPSAPILGVAEAGSTTFFAGRLEAFDRDLFVKERSGKGGRFVLSYRRIAPFQYVGPSGLATDLEAVMAQLREYSATRRLIIQPKLENHPAIRSLADQALSVFRVVTCLDWRGEPHVTHGLLRMICRFEPNWPKTADSDWGCAIDLETGGFGMLTGDAPATATRWFECHPVTGERVYGRILEGWPEIAAVAIAAHRVFASRMLVGWDIGWTPDGVRILEGNNNLDFSYFQRCYRLPVGRSPLGPLLNTHLDALTARLLADVSVREAACR
jgi:Sugar-transfer associated ATP-grasp